MSIGRGVRWACEGGEMEIHDNGLVERSFYKSQEVGMRIKLAAWEAAWSSIGAASALPAHGIDASNNTATNLLPLLIIIKRLITGKLEKYFFDDICLKQQVKGLI
jgi:hypothetical protein